MKSPISSSTFHHSSSAPLLRKCLHGGRAGFSLIEVVIAVGVVTIALLPMLALLPIGLKSVRESMDQTVSASIAQQIRGELDQASFGTNANNTNTLNLLSSLPTNTNYYSEEGILLANTSSLSDPPYYIATFATNPVTSSVVNFTNNNAQMVTVTLSYPFSHPANARSTNIISLLIARQTSSQ